jgi:predicted enzyme related to lactoylglutathione lyase
MPGVRVEDLAPGAAARRTMPRSAVAGMGWAAYCEDTEGNAFVILKPDPAAK